MEETQSVIGKFLDPDKIIAQLDVSKGSTVVDFGCGPGYFSIPFAKIVGEDGRVYALDILPQVLENVIGKAKNSGVSNIITKRVNFEKENGSKLEANFADWIVMKDVLFQNQKKEVIIAEAYRVLKPGGKIIVVEWNYSETTFGPAAELRIARSALEKMFNDRKFIIEKDVEAGHFHYAFVAAK